MLIGSSDADHRAQLYWRISLPLMTLIISFVAISLGQVNPRKGRFARLLPAILVYLMYLSVLTSLRDDMTRSVANADIKIWLLHLSVFTLGLFLLFGRQWFRRLSKGEAQVRLLDIHIAKHIWAAVAVVLLVILGLDLMTALGSELDALGQGASFKQVLTYIALTVPRRVYEFMPLAVLVGCLVGLGILANNSELTVMRAAGISLRRIVWSVMQSVALFVVTAAILGEYVAPVSQQMAEIEQAEYKGAASTKGFWLREGDDYIFVRSVMSDGVLQGVSRYRFDDNNWKQTLVADKGVYEDQQWTLQQIRQVGLEGQNIVEKEQQTIPWSVSLKPNLLSILSMDPKHLAVEDLMQYSQYLDQSGLDSAPYELAFWKKTLQPLATSGSRVFGYLFCLSALLDSVTLGTKSVSGGVGRLGI